MVDIPSSEFSGIAFCDPEQIIAFLIILKPDMHKMVSRETVNHRL
jgi:hypothetical protein